MGEKGCIQVVPILGGVVLKPMPGCHGCKPSVGLMHKTDMRQVVLGCIKTDYVECCLTLRLAAKNSNATEDRKQQSFQGCGTYELLKKFWKRQVPIKV